MAHEGERYNMTVVVRDLHRRSWRGGNAVECQCDCGRTFETTIGQLRNGEAGMCRACFFERNPSAKGKP